jgi:hypothetical protein
MQGVPSFCVELDSPAHRAWRSRRHQPLALRLAGVGAGAARLAGAAFALRLPP